ncbi:MAG: hypothetical protein IT463_02955 [Planctomycetes bacterium]|nr:hypothetical protein [Planctomycetota bacterium]
MSGVDTSVLGRDSQGTRLVIGQAVFSLLHKRAGQLMGITQPAQICVVRFNDGGEVTSLPAAQLLVATWDQLRGETRTTDSRRFTRTQISA